MVCSSCGKPMDASARFCSNCGAPFVGQSYAAPGPLVRPLEGRRVAGVCIGFAQHFGWDVTVVRLVLVLAAVFGVGTPVLAYFIAWIVLPNGTAYIVPTQGTPTA